MKRVQQVMKKISDFLNTRWGGLLALAVAVGAFLALTLTRLTSSSIWFDESYSAYLMRYDWADLTHYTAVDVHPPLYYYLLKLWTMLFGTSVAALRSLTVVLGVVALILLFVLMRRLFNRRTASLATILVAISPMFVRYGIETRMYMMVVVIALLATIVFVKLLHSEKRRWYILYGLLIALGMWTHYFMAVIWLSHWVYRWWYLRHHNLRGRRLARSFFSANWLIAHGLAIVLYLPWIPIAFTQMTGLAKGYWIPPVTVDTPGDYLTSSLMFLESSRVDGWLAVAVFAVVAMLIRLAYLLARRLRGQQLDNYMLIVTLALAPVVILITLSLYPFKSVFTDRYLIAAIVFLVSLIAVCLTLSRDRRLAGCLAVLVLGCFAYGVVNVYRLGNYNRYGGDDKITMTGEVVEMTKRAADRVPVIAMQTYGYYEAAVYEDDQHPVYFLWDNVRNDQTGSLLIQRDNKLGRGITDLAKFAQEHAQVWLVGHSTDDQIAPPVGGEDWRAVKTVAATDPLTGSHGYKATLYDTGPVDK